MGYFLQKNVHYYYMKRLFFLAGFLISVQAVAQTPESKTLLTIGDNYTVSQAEFERLYIKNNNNVAYDSASLANYLNLFIDYKLKVVEALSLGMDTVDSFKRELAGYRSQLEKPFFTDEKVDAQLEQEAYERMHWDINASHILISCAEDASPSDTLKAYNKLEKIRKQIVNKKADFGQMARQYSEDPSAQSNNGSLGYFTAFQMIYPFEKEAYTTPVGEVSEIFRTRFGYHILKVHDRRENPGRINAAHILFQTTKDFTQHDTDSVLALAKAVFASLKQGADWNNMVVTYSNDKGSVNRGGNLGWFSTGDMVTEFESGAYSLKNIGDISEPIKTNYGYHIIKLLGKEPLPPIEKMQKYIRSRMSRDVRSTLARKSVCDKLKNEYHFSENQQALSELYSVIDESIWEGKWDTNKANNLTKTVFSFADTIIFTQKDIANQIVALGTPNKKTTIENLVKTRYEQIVENAIFNHEKSQLETKYPDFKYLMQEYHDGILLFSLSDENIWTKAVKDTAGLQTFYEANKENYMWGDRIEIAEFDYTTEITKANLDTNKVNKTIISAIKKGAKKGTYDTTIKNKLIKAKVDSTMLENRVKVKIYTFGSAPITNSIEKKAGASKIITQNGTTTIYYVTRLVPAMPKTLSECKGNVTADYQNKLEKDWIEHLRAKYKVVCNKEVFNSMIK